MSTKQLNIILDQLSMQVALAPDGIGVHLDAIRNLCGPGLDRLAGIDAAGLPDKAEHIALAYASRTPDEIRGLSHGRSVAALLDAFENLQTLLDVVRALTLTIDTLTSIRKQADQENVAIRAAWLEAHDVGGTEAPEALTCMLQAIHAIRSKDAGNALVIEHYRAEVDKLTGQRDTARAEVERYSQREIAFQYAPEETRLPAPLACPNCEKSWSEFLGDSGLMLCNKEHGGCGFSLSLDAADPENLRAARDLARRERDAARAQLETARGYPRCLACGKDCDSADEVRVHARECEPHEVCQLIGKLSAEKARADALTSGIVAYRDLAEKCTSLRWPNVLDWERANGHLVPQ